MVHVRRRGSVIVHTPNGILVVSEGGRTFLLPGGVARRHESRRSAAIRELKEETGLEAVDCSYLFEYKVKVHKDRRKVV
jgi:8-oxo-dGTP pyrophosphatase MutT (NUDIX family)